jgi:hypothetical protein
MPRLATFRSAALIALAVFLLPRAASAESIACATGDFQPVDIATVPTTQTTTSKAMRNLPGARLNLGSQTCMRVQFSAQVKAATGGLRIRVLVDGAPITPSFVDFHTTGPDFDTRTATFVVPNLSVDTHLVTVQYASTNGKPVAVSKAMMTVWRNSIPP